jgi:peptidoglycan hydrolase CwlO-like protein
MAFRFVIFLVIVFTFFAQQPVFSAECRTDCTSVEECERFINECTQVIAPFAQANLANKQTLADFERQIKSLEQMVASAAKQIAAFEEKITDEEADLAVQKILLAEKVKRFYIFSRQNNTLTIFFADKSNAYLLKNIFYQQMLAEKDKKEIANLSLKLAALKKDQENLKAQKEWLAQSQKNFAEKAAFLKKEVEKAEKYIGQLSSTIETLTAKQKNLLAARSGTFTSSVGEVPISFIPCSGPPGSPSYCNPGGGTWFAVFSFGAWTHRKGMSQYGAKGRAEAGQNSDQILQAYYGKTPVDKDTGGTISVSGHGNLDFENYYLMGIAEMPSDWHKEALKAQAIAARSYAYRYKAEGRSICTTQACQVFSKSKADNPPAAWREAVNETKGKVFDGVGTFDSSTAGGYLTTSGWDTTDGQGGSGFASRAWESKAGSPWFYSSWYTQNYTAGSAKCSRSHPWLTAEEMADILNAWLVGSDERILPTTINQCPVGGVSGNPYSMDELKNKANEKGGAFTSVSEVSVTYSNDGATAAVNFTTNKGSVSIPGSEFKQAFNLRAPGHIAIRSPLFNVEKK